MSDTSRLFFAFWPDESIRDKAAILARQFQRDYGGRCMTKESLHITLAFLGETPNSYLPELRMIGSGVMTPAFNLQLSRAGSWPGGIFWLAPAESPPALSDLTMTLYRSLKASGIPFDGKPFVPHMTLLRRAKYDGAQITIAPLLELAVQDFVLVRTLRLPEGVAHEIVHRFPLAKNS